jgi:acetyl esterase/lipase
VKVSEFNASMKRSAIILATVYLCALTPATSMPDTTKYVSWQQPFSEVESLDYREADQRIPYGPSTQQFVDVWYPGNDIAAAPVIALIHGGCWLADYDISHIGPLANAIAEQGFAVWAIEYRRVGQDGGGWPGTFHDIASAMDRLSMKPDPRLDATRTVVVGHSAGGHLALWAAGRDRLSEDQELYRKAPFLPAAAVGLAAITDLESYATGGNSCQQVTVKLMGGLPTEQPERYDQASPATLGTDIPVVLVQGDTDGIVPPAQAERLAQARSVMIEEAGHFDLIHPRSPAFGELVRYLQEMSNP